MLRAEIETDRTGDRTALLPDLNLMARQVHQLLHLAEASEERNYVFEPTDVIAIAESVVDYLGRLALQRKVYVSICDLRRAPTATALRADRGALYMLLKNILENAIQHSPPDAVVELVIDENRTQRSRRGARHPRGRSAESFYAFLARLGAARRRRGAGARDLPADRYGSWLAAAGPKRRARSRIHPDFRESFRPSGDKWPGSRLTGYADSLAMRRFPRDAQIPSRRARLPRDAQIPSRCADCLAMRRLPRDAPTASRCADCPRCADFRRAIRCHGEFAVC